MMRPLLPGRTIGILGSGQLGRMLAVAARRYGYRIHVYSPDCDTPAGQVADEEFCRPYDDRDGLEAFARRVDVVTFEFENVPLATAEHVTKFAPVQPGLLALGTAQHRIREKTFLRNSHLPTPRFAAVLKAADLPEALAITGLPAVLKTAASGYDGKGQQIVRSLAEAEEAWRGLGEQPLIAEQFIEFACEVSVVGVRSARGDFRYYGPIRNEHRRHILDLASCPAELPLPVATSAIEITRSILEGLEAVGVVCVEFFVTGRDEVLVNEIAPRPHNSGHLTIEAHETCQFEQQLRAICNLPLGSTRQRRPAAMANLLGDLWQSGEPRWMAALKARQTRLHLYGKHAATSGRKMGHLTALGRTVADARDRVQRIRERLRPVLPSGERGHS